MMSLKKFEHFPNTVKSFSAVCADVQKDPSGKKPNVRRSQITWPREGDAPTSRQIDVSHRHWDYLPRTLKTFVPPAHADHAFKTLGRGHCIGCFLAVLGLDMSDTECEKTHLQKRHLAKKEDPDAMMVKPGLVFAAGALNSAHWTSPPIKKLEERSVKHLVKQCTHEIDEVQAQIDNEMHQLHFEVLLRHEKRVIKILPVVLRLMTSGIGT